MEEDFLILFCTEDINLVFSELRIIDFFFLKVA